jgi:uncharacterized protein YoxC
MAITYRIGHDGRLSVEEMDGNFQYIEDGLGNLGASFSQLEVMVESLDLAGLTASVLGLEGDVVGLTSDVAGLTASVLVLEGDVAGLTSDVASATASIATLNTNVASATASIATLNTNLASATASVLGLEGDVAGLTASVIDLQNTFSNINGDFNFLLLVGGVTQSGTFSFTNGILATYSLV